MKNSEQPAFPPSVEMCEISKIETYPFGLTKREYFTGLAMQGIMADGDTSDIPAIATAAIRVADELLKQLES